MTDSVVASDQPASGTDRSVAPSRVAPRTVLVVSAFGAFLAFLDATVVNVAFPDIRESFPGTSVSGLSWVLNAYNIVFASFLIVFGRLADLLGRRRVFAHGILVFTLASVWCALAPSLGMLVTARVLQGVGAAMLVPASLAVIVEAFPPERRAHAISLWGASGAVAAALGPPVGGALIELGGWRWAFLVNLPVGLVAWSLARRRLVESRAPGRRRMPDVRGALLLAAALTLLTLALVQGNDWGWTSLSVLGSLGATAVLTAGFVLSSRAHPQPLLDPKLLRIPSFAVGNLVTTVAGAGFYAYMLTNILWLQYVWGYDILRAGLALVPGAVVAAVVAARLGPLAQAHGYRRIVVPGALCWASAYAWYALAVGTSPAFWSEWLPGQVLSGIGVGATLPLLGSAALAAVPGGRFATASAVVSATRHLGGALGIALLVVLIGTPTAANADTVLRSGWWLCVGAFVVSALGALALRVGAATEEDVSEVGGHAAALHLPRQVGGAHDQEVTLPLPASAHETYFGRLPDAVRARLEADGAQLSVPAGQWLFRAGDPAQEMYVVLGGRLEVHAGGAVVREVGPGSVLGELALLTGGVRSASVRARRDTTLLVVSHEVFADAMAADRAAPLAVARALAEQLAAPPAAAVPSGGHPVVVSVVGLGVDAPVAEVADALATGMAAHLRVHAGTRLTPDGLARAEREHDRVVLHAPDPGPAGDGEARAWWQSCLRQADRVVLVARSDAVVPEQWAGPEGPDLVLVGPRPTPEQVAAWAGAVAPWQVTVVDGAVPAGLTSLVARLSGRSLGIVLAGGGARAMAHIGVLHELEAAGVVVDRVAGCSIGSIIGGLFARGHDAAEIEAICYEEFVRRQPFSDYTVPVAALAKGRRKIDAIRRRMGVETRIESLPRQFRCVSTDLLSRAQHVHRGGLLWEAVAASARLPVLFPPLRAAGTLLVDGGVLDNLPVEALTERDEGPLLAVNIGMGGGSAPAPAAALNGAATHGAANGGPVAPPRPARPLRVPALGETLLRTMMIGSGGAVEKARASGAYVISPPPLGVGLLEFHQLDRMVESGRMSARALLEATGGDLVQPVPAATRTGA